MLAILVFADFANCQETVAWVLCNFVACWKISWLTFTALYLREEVDRLVFAATKGDILLVQEILYPF